jgi:flagellar assembly protein FliH
MSELFVAHERRAGGFSRDARYSPLPRGPISNAHDDIIDRLALAREEGRAAGFAEASANAEAERQTAQRLEFSFQRLDGELAEQLRDKLHATVTALCESTLHPLALDRDALRRRIEVAVAMFVRADDERIIRLHPEDIAASGDRLPSGWQVVPDPALERGALRVETTGGGLEDGPAQWRTAIEEALRLC